MDSIVFDGQQTDERILTALTPSQSVLVFSVTKLLFILTFFYTVTLMIATVVDRLSNGLILWSSVLFASMLFLSVAWTRNVYKKSITYLTDRRIMRFELISPFYTAKRSLFWTEALKIKAYQTNLFWRMQKIGTVEVEPQAASRESVRITDVYLYEDVANYIEKILYTVKNKPQEIVTLRPFVLKTKGNRD